MRVGRHRRISVRDPRVREREIRIDLDRLPEKLYALVKFISGAPGVMITALQVKLIGVGTGPVTIQNGGFFAAEQFQLERVHDRKRDLVLDLKYVPHLAVIAFGPNVITVGAVDQLDGYSYSVQR